MRIFNDDGTKEFKTVEEYRLWEEEDYCRQKKEQEERAKAVAKAEAERKIAEEKRRSLLQNKPKKLDEIMTKAKELNVLINEHKKNYGTVLYISYDSVNGIKIKEADTFGDLFNSVVNSYYYRSDK